MNNYPIMSKIMRRVLIMLVILINVSFSMISCSSSEDLIPDENNPEKVMLSLKPTLEINSTELQTRAEDEVVYVALIQKMNSNEEMEDYSWGIFTDINNMFLLVDKGTYNIKITLMNKEPFKNSVKEWNYNEFKFNYFTNEDYYLCNAGSKNTIVNYINYGVKIGNNYYGETNNIQITKASDINIELKYMTFGIELEGINLLKSDNLKITFYNGLEIQVDRTNPKSKVTKCSMPGILRDYYKNSKSDIDAMIYLNDKRLFNNSIKVQVERKKITTVKVDCKRMNISKEDSTLIEGNIVEY